MSAATFAPLHVSTVHVFASLQSAAALHDVGSVFEQVPAEHASTVNRLPSPHCVAVVQHPGVGA